MSRHLGSPGWLLAAWLITGVLTVTAAALLFYLLTILGLFRLRVSRPGAPRPYRAFGYPVVPALYVVGAAVLVGVLVVYRLLTTWPGLGLVCSGSRCTTCGGLPPARKAESPGPDSATAIADR
jgi:hypothetical protein